MALRPLAALSLLLTLVAGQASAAPCGGDFGVWLAAFRQEATAAGISEGTLNLALSALAPDPQVIALDRKQGYFKQSFEKYRAKRVTPGKIDSAISRLQQNAALFAHREAVRRPRADPPRHLGA